MAKGGGDTFTSRWGLLLTALGAAIGTGNIWRFPKEVANNGGGSFMIPYILFLLTWSIPILLVEFASGKKTRKGTMGTFATLVGKEKAWMGAWMAWISTAIGFYYAIVMGWTIKYAIGAFSLNYSDPQASWDSFMQVPYLIVIFQIVAIAITTFVVYRGVEKGVEKVNKILIPALFILMIGNMIRALFLPGAMRGIAYLFTPGEELFSAKTWVAALAQSAWSCSAGMGMAIAFGAYTKRKQDTSLNSFLTGFGDTTISLIAGIMIFTTVFALSPNIFAAEAAVEEGGTGLTFIYLPGLFGQVPFGRFISLFFFIAMGFAALTSMIAGYENAVKNFVDLGWPRKKVILLLSAFIFLLGLPSALIILPVNGHPMPLFLDHQDYVWGMGLLISGGFIYYLVYKYGVTRFRNNIINSRYSDLHIGKWFDILFKYVIPVELVLLVGWYVLQSVLANPFEEWWMGGPIGLGLLVLEWGIAMIALWLFSNKVKDRLVDPGMDPYQSIDKDIDERESMPVEVQTVE